MSEDLKRDYDD